MDGAGEDARSRSGLGIEHLNTGWGVGTAIVPLHKIIIAEAVLTFPARIGAMKKVLRMSSHGTMLPGHIRQSHILERQISDVAQGGMAHAANGEHAADGDCREKTQLFNQFHQDFFSSE